MCVCALDEWSDKRMDQLTEGEKLHNNSVCVQFSTLTLIMSFSSELQSCRHRVGHNIDRIVPLILYGHAHFV